MGLVSPGSTFAGGQRRFSKMPALLDTGAGRTVLTPLAVTTVGLPQIDTLEVSRAGGFVTAGVHVAAIQFPRYKLATIEIIEVVACELPAQPIQCLLGRDVLSRWLFTYNGTSGVWSIEEEDIAAWITPPDEIDT